MSYLALAKKAEARLKIIENADAVQASEPVDVDMIDGDVQAVLIQSAVLYADIWLILRPGFIPADGLAYFYVDEIRLLKNKTSEQLRAIHQVKLAFPGCRVIQERPDK